MEKYRNYGFILGKTKSVSNCQYDDIKGSICEICGHIEIALSEYKAVSNFAISIPINRSENIYGVVSVNNAKINFYIYKQGFLYSEYPADEIDIFYKTDSGKQFAKRCYTLSKKFLDGELSKDRLIGAPINEALIQFQNDYALITSKTITPQTLHCLAQKYFNNASFCLSIAKSKYTHPNTLYALAHHPSIDVRQAVALHPNTNFKTLEVLTASPETITFAMNNPNYLNSATSSKQTLS